MKKLLLFILLVCLPASATAFEDDDPCSGTSAMQQGLCVAAKLKIADQKLNKTYKEALERIREEDKFIRRDLEEKFRSSQRAWLKFRNSYCEFEGESTGAGGGWPGVHTSNCILDMTNDRISYFEKVLSEG